MRYQRQIRPMLVSALLPVLLAACGLMFGGTRQTVQVMSAPEGAKVTTTPETADFTTPASLSLERKYDYTLTFAKAGYSPARLQVTHSIRAGILVLDILFTGLLGIIPDAATGAWFKLTPQTATVTLTKLAMTEGPDEIRVGVRIGDAPDGGTAQIGASEPGVTVRVQATPR